MAAPELAVMPTMDGFESEKMERRCGVTFFFFFFVEIRVLREIEFENSWGRLIAPFTVLLFFFFFCFF